MAVVEFTSWAGVEGRMEFMRRPIDWIWPPAIPAARFEKAPELALALSKRMARQVSLPGPTGNCLHVKAEIFRGSVGRERLISCSS